jgi:hypothetical protein
MLSSLFVRTQKVLYSNWLVQIGNLFFAGCRFQHWTHFIPPESGFASLSHKVRFGEVDHFVAAATQHGTNEIETEP